MKTPNILLIGKAGVGKDEVTKILCQKYNYTNYQMSYWLKETIKSHYGLNNPSKGTKINIGKKELTYRAVLQHFGTEFIRRFDPLWHITETIQRIHEEPFVISDVRFFNEIEELKKTFNCITVRVKCNETQRVMRICQRDSLVPCDKTNNHVSETELDVYIADYEIENSESLNELENNIKHMMGGIR